MKINSLDIGWAFRIAVSYGLASGLLMFDSLRYQLEKTSAVIVVFLVLFSVFFGVIGDKKQWRKTLNEPVLWAFLGYLFLSFFTIVYILGIGDLEDYLLHYLGHLLLLFGAVWLYVNLQSDRWFLDNFAKVIFWGVWVYLALLMVTMYHNLYYVAGLEKFFYNPRNGVYSFVKLAPILLASRLWLQRDNPGYNPHKDWLVYLVFGVIFLCAARFLRRFDFIPSDISWFFSPYVLAGYGLVFGYRFMQIRSTTKPFYKDPWLWIILGFFLLHLGLMNLEYRVFASHDEEQSARHGWWWIPSEAMVLPLVLGFLAMVVYWVRFLLGKSIGKAMPWFGILAVFLGVYIFYFGLGDAVSVVGKADYRSLGGGAYREIRPKCGLLSAFSDIFYINPSGNLASQCDRWLFGYLGPRINYHGYLTEVLHRTGLPGILLLGLGFILPFVYWLNRAEQKGAWVALISIVFSFSFLIAIIEEDRNFLKYRELMYGLSIYPMVITLAIIRKINRYSKPQPDEN